MEYLTNTQKIPILIDEDQLENVKPFDWYIGSDGYAFNNIVGRLHIFLFGRAPEGFEWDHINRNKLDNQRGNLDIVTFEENNRNRGAQCNSLTGHRGISFYEIHRYKAIIHQGKKRIYLGIFDTLEDAIKARQEGELKFWGKTYS